MKPNRMGAALAAMLLMAAAPAVAQTQKLGSFTVDLSKTTVSGLSSGAFMAIQFQIAFSSTVAGAGVVAGGPYFCAQGSSFGALLNCTGFITPSPAVPDPASLLSQTKTFAQQGKIDALDNLAKAKIYLYSGLSDRTVPSTVVDAARRYFLLAGVPKGSLEYDHDIDSGHAFITKDTGNPCPTSNSPFINNCNFDQAGAVLKKLYGQLKDPSVQRDGQLIQFDQQEFVRGTATAVAPVTPAVVFVIVPASAVSAFPEFPGFTGLPGTGLPGTGLPGTGLPGMPSDPSMNDVGYVYVPQSCQQGSTCRVHVAFHGCEQTLADIDTDYVTKTGFNAWADSNDIIVLYPQAKKSQPANPKGCWDWWGYSGADYAFKSGVQMEAVKAMLDRLAKK